MASYTYNPATGQWTKNTTETPPQKEESGGQKDVVNTRNETQSNPSGNLTSTRVPFS